jgi:hypothetical protein
VMQSLPPGMQHRNRADLSAEITRIGGDAVQRLGRSTKQNGVDHRLVVVSGASNPRVSGAAGSFWVRPPVARDGMEPPFRWRRRGMGSRRRTDRLTELRASATPTVPWQVRYRRRAPHRAGHECRTSILPIRAFVYGAAATGQRRPRYQVACFCVPAAACRLSSAAAVTADRSTAPTAVPGGHGARRCGRRASATGGPAMPGRCMRRRWPAGGRGREKK